MRIALCQVNCTIGAFDDNRQRIVRAVATAAGEGAELCVFPEMAVCGYPPRDLLDRPGFVADNLRSIERLVAELPRRPAVLVGFVERAGEPRPRLYNSAALICDGAVRQVFRKRLLPSYDVFDEKRYFEPGDAPLCVDLDGRRLGVLICEDAWNHVESPVRQHYDRDPVAQCVDAGADLLINLSASPFTCSKVGPRAQMFGGIARAEGRPFVFVNQVGGNDDILFDGSSAVFGGDGAVWARAAGFAEQVLTCDLAPGQSRTLPAASDEQAALSALTMGTADYARKCGFSRAVLGLSGGIDSSLVAAIAARALGPDKVLGVAMPTRYSSQGSLDDARALAGNLGIEFRVVDIDGLFQRYLDLLGPELDGLCQPPAHADTTFENIQARIRGNTLMAISNRCGHLLLTTGNKSEIAVGYCTLYGDMAGGLAVISDLPKTFVYRVAREVNRQAGRELIPRSCIEKAPSAELRPDQKDEDSLPAYEQLDAVLELFVEQGMVVDEIVDRGFARPLVERVAGMVRSNEYKRRQMPPGLIVTRKAFGQGRRYPIAQRYQ